MDPMGNLSLFRHFTSFWKKKSQSAHTSTVGFPRLSKTWRAWSFWIGMVSGEIRLAVGARRLRWWESFKVGLEIADPDCYKLGPHVKPMLFRGEKISPWQTEVFFGHLFRGELTPFRTGRGPSCCNGHAWTSQYTSWDQCMVYTVYMHACTGIYLIFLLIHGYIKIPYVDPVGTESLWLCVYPSNE